MFTGKFYVLLIIGSAFLLFLLTLGLEFVAKRLFVNRVERSIAGGVQYGKALKESYRRAVSSGWTVVIAMAFGLVMAVLFGIEESEARAYLLLIGGIFMGLFVSIYLVASPRRIKRGGLLLVLEKVMREGRKAEVEGLALAAIGFGDLKVQMTLVQAMERWGGEAALEVVVKLRERIRGYAEVVIGVDNYAQEVIRKLDYARKTKAREDIVGYEQLGGTYLLYKRLGEAASLADADKLRWFAEGEGEQFAFHTRMQALNQAFPDVCCQKCWARGEQVQLEHHKVVRCKRCQESEHLLLGVKGIKGLIGMEHDWKREGEMVEVGLWDAGKKTVRFAEVDATRFEAGNMENPDWSLARILEALRNQMPPEKMPIPIENEPPEGISPNALLQLEAITVRN